MVIKISKKTNNKEIYDKVYENGFELLEPFSGRIVNKHHVKCLKCGCSEYIDGTPYKKSINDIVNNNRGCIFCCGKKPTKQYNLLTYYPEIIEYWDYKLNTTKPEEHVPFSNDRVYVKCPICGISKLKKCKTISENKTCRCVSCVRKITKGIKHPRYNKNLTDEQREKNRDKTENINFRNEVYKRDDYTCKLCGVKGGRLNAHHLDGYEWCVDKRFDIDNGITLCDECHKKFHHIYGYGGNTREQFKEFTNLNYI